AALNNKENHFVLVQQDRGAASFARSLHLENPEIATCVVDLPFDHPQAVEWIAAEAGAARGHVDVRYDRTGARFEPRLAAAPLSGRMGDWPMNSSDVLLITGGG